MAGEPDTACAEAGAGASGAMTRLRIADCASEHARMLAARARHDASIMLAEITMATLTIRNVPLRVVRSLKSLARRNRRSMEREVRAVLEEHVGDRLALFEQIERSWTRQTRRPKAREVDGWIGVGRE